MEFLTLSVAVHFDPLIASSMRRHTYHLIQQYVALSHSLVNYTVNIKSNPNACYILCTLYQTNILTVMGSTRKIKFSDEENDTFRLQLQSISAFELDGMTFAFQRGARYVLIPVNDDTKFHWSMLVLDVGKQVFIARNSLAGRKVDQKLERVVSVNCYTIFHIENNIHSYVH